MRVRLKRDLTLPMATEGSTFYVQTVSTGRDGKKIYFVSYYGSAIAFPADACEVLQEEKNDEEI